MYKLVRKSANFPPHPAIPNTQNPWLTISEHETLEGAMIALKECLPSSMWVYGIVDEKEQVIDGY